MSAMEDEMLVRRWTCPAAIVEPRDSTDFLFSE